MNIVAIIAARQGSSRLPGKTLMPVAGKPMLERMVERIRCAPSIDSILVATTTLPEDDELEAFCDTLGISCFRGSENDVLGRIVAAVNETDADTIVELLGDNPLVDGELIEDVIDLYRTSGADYAVNLTNEYPKADPNLLRFPIGVRAQAFSRATLDRCDADGRSADHREHSTSYIGEHPEIFKIEYLEARDKWGALNRPELTFAVNVAANLELINRIFTIGLQVNPNFSMADTINIFDADPDLAALVGNEAKL
jgi:spore coat polysaccharide biosynthesis protein SpsF